MSRPALDPVRSIRVRYIVGLSALALVIATTYAILQTTIAKQEFYGRVITIAGNQIGLSNRIAFFVGQMMVSATEEDYQVARQQLGRAINQMHRHHEALLNGDEKLGVPRISTPLLETIYHDKAYGLDLAHRRFLARAWTVYNIGYGDLTDSSGAYIYVVNYGPYVLETLLNAAVTEYEDFARAEIEKLQRFELIAMSTAILVMLLEAVFIFRPLERKVRGAFDGLAAQHAAIAREKERAEAASRSKTSFLASVSHELRTPLNAIIGFSESLKTGIYGPLASGRQVECVDAIHRSGVYLLDLVNDLLQVSAAESGRVALQEETVSLPALIDEAIGALGTMALTARVRVTVEGGRPGPRLFADGRRIRQVLINLLTNAVKFTPADGVVTVRIIDRGDRADRPCGFVVRDTGIGMTRREIEVARERFGQVHDVMTRPHPGTGLGLPVAIDLVAAHGGTLDIESEKGAGTSVTVLFPAGRVIPAPPEAPPRAAADGRGGGTGGAKDRTGPAPAEDATAIA